MHKYGESKTTRIVMATVPHVTAWAELTKYQAAWFLLKRVYQKYMKICTGYPARQRLLKFLNIYKKKFLRKDHCRRFCAYFKIPHKLRIPMSKFRKDWRWPYVSLNTCVNSQFWMRNNMKLVLIKCN
jgi:hypothetical protein